MLLRTVFPAALCCIPLAALTAADDLDQHNGSIRLEGSRLFDTLDVDATANSTLGSVSRSGEVEFEDAWRVGLIGVSTHHSENGVVAFGSGGGIQYSNWYDGGNYDEQLQALTATLRLGVVIRPSEFFRLEAMPYGAVGGARGDVGDSRSDIGLYWEAGGIASAIFTFSNLDVGAHAGYLWNGADLEFDEDANFGAVVDNVETELRGEGFFYGVTVGTRF